LRVAITGVAGFLGSHLAERLLARGDEVRGLDDLSAGRREHLTACVGQPRFVLREASLFDPTALAALVEGVEVVVHLAAGRRPRRGDALETLTITGQGSLNLLEAARAARVRRVVLASSAECYGRSPQPPFAEDAAAVLGPPQVHRWAYAVAKLYAEQLLFACHQRHGVEGVALRLFGIYGPRQRVAAPAGAVSAFLTAALRGEPMELHGSGRQTRSLTYVDDVVEAFVRALEAPAAGELINVGHADEVPIEELARRIWRLVRDDEPRLREVPLSSFGRWEEVERRFPDVRRTAHVLGFVPATGLDQGLPPTLAWQREALRREGLL
jgi:UDP-glucose 4-epimerase